MGEQDSKGAKGALRYLALASCTAALSTRGEAGFAEPSAGSGERTIDVQVQWQAYAGLGIDPVQFASSLEQRRDWEGDSDKVSYSCFPRLLPGSTTPLCPLLRADR